MPGRTIFDMGRDLMRHFSDVTWTTTATNAAPPIVTYQTLADTMRLLQQQPNAAEQAAAMQQAALQNVAWNQQNPQMQAALQNAQAQRQQNLMRALQNQQLEFNTGQYQNFYAALAGNANQSKPVVSDESKLNAEVLLKQILAEPQYLSLNALGYFDVDGKTYKNYRLKRGSKTHVTDKDGVVWSACIHLSDPSAPDADRIVAEYLLILNDEAEYLKTANLTRVGGVATAVGQDRLRGHHINGIYIDEAGNLPVR